MADDPARDVPINPRGHPSSLTPLQHIADRTASFEWTLKLGRLGEDRAGRDGSRVALGQTTAAGICA
jgi:hypothetical protein